MSNLKMRFRINALTQGAMFAAILCMLCPLAIPVGPVPVTLGTYVILFMGTVVEWKPAAAAVLIYLLVGFIGLPVFSGGTGGLGVLTGPTGGYLWCYLPMALLVSRFGRGGGWLRAALASVPAMLVCYVMGTLQYVELTSIPVSVALKLCVWPFVPFDIGKLVCAAMLGVRVRSRLQEAGLL